MRLVQQPQSREYNLILTGEKIVTFEDLHDNLSLMGRPLLNDVYYAEGLDLDGPGAFCRTTPLLFFRLTGYDLVLSSTSDLRKVPANVIIAAASQRLPLDITGMKGNVTAEFTAGIDSCLREFSRNRYTICNAIYQEAGISPYADHPLYRDGRR